MAPRRPALIPRERMESPLRHDAGTASLSAGMGSPRKTASCSSVPVVHKVGTAARVRALFCRDSHFDKPYVPTQGFQCSPIRLGAFCVKPSPSTLHDSKGCPSAMRFARHRAGSGAARQRLPCAPLPGPLRQLPGGSALVLLLSIAALQAPMCRTRSVPSRRCIGSVTSSSANGPQTGFCRAPDSGSRLLSHL